MCGVMALAAIGSLLSTAALADDPEPPFPADVYLLKQGLNGVSYGSNAEALEAVRTNKVAAALVWPLSLHDCRQSHSEAALLTRTDLLVPSKELGALSWSLAIAVRHWYVAHGRRTDRTPMPSCMRGSAGGDRAPRFLPGNRF
jgi:hypothetical protein